MAPADTLVSVQPDPPAPAPADTPAVPAGPADTPVLPARAEDISAEISAAARTVQVSPSPEPKSAFRDGKGTAKRSRWAPRNQHAGNVRVHAAFVCARDASGRKRARASPCTRMAVPHVLAASADVCPGVRNAWNGRVSRPSEIRPDCLEDGQHWTRRRSVVLFPRRQKGERPDTAAPGQRSLLPHLRRDCAHRCHICSGT
jgi:hypothetical protein